VNIEGAGRKSHQQGNVLAEITELACATARAWRGEIGGQDGVISTA